jgi:hypothetical protein
MYGMRRMIKASIAVVCLVLAGLASPWGGESRAQEESADAVAADEVEAAQPPVAKPVLPPSGETPAEAAAETPDDNAAADTADTAEAADEPAAAKVPRKSGLYSNSYALVVGINTYTNGWPNLNNAVKDAELMAGALKERGFEVTLATNLNSVEMKQTFEEFFVIKGEDPQARLFVWYAGHGFTEFGEGFLVPADAPRPEAGARFRLKALSLRRFGEYVRMAYSKHAYTVFDTCFAGTIFASQRGAPPPAITRAAMDPVRQFQTAGDADQEVPDDGRFRELFLAALEGERGADANTDGYLTATEIGIFLGNAVSNYSQNRQTPRYGKLRDPDYDQGDFVFDLPGTEGGALATPESGEVAPVVQDDAVELAFWDAVKDSGSPARLEAYLAKYPQGAFAELAQLHIAELKEQEQKLAALAQKEAEGEANAYKSRDEIAVYVAENREAMELRLHDYIRRANISWPWLQRPYISGLDVQRLDDRIVVADIAYKADAFGSAETAETRQFTMKWTDDKLEFITHKKD